MDNDIHTRDELEINLFRRWLRISAGRGILLIALVREFFILLLSILVVYNNLNRTSWVAYPHP